MTSALIVAASVDADFAEEVRAKTRGLAIEIAPAVPADGRRPVLLVWSAARPVTASDVPVLVELASRGRLVIARRDGTALPPGLGDLDALPTGASARDAAFRLLQATLAPGDAPAAPLAEASPSAPAVAAPLPPAPPVVVPPPQRGGVAWLVVAMVAVLAVGGVILASLRL